MSSKIILKNNWSLKYDSSFIPASVPGDVTIDFYKAGLISDPYIAMNYKEAEFIDRKDVTYINEFEVSQELYSYDDIVLVFKGVDLFADIYVNDQFVGHTKNAFLKYEYHVKDLVKVGKNKLEVKMISTMNEMDKIDTTGYFACFNVPRIFVRKPQCHFGWDWAPKICAYGIIDDVILEGRDAFQILDVRVNSDDKGNVIFNALANYDNKDFKGPDEEVLKAGVPFDNDKYIFYVSKVPFGNEYHTYEVDLMGKKTFCAVSVKDFKLWWPTGYGEQPLYNYKVELYRGGKLRDTKSGRFAFRTVKVLEEPKEGNKVGFDFYINNTKIFLKGSNWIPPECFTGVMTDEKYRKEIALAKAMNSNILRVWGGGAYEKDIFFDICDEEGILVWQDIGLACADIPEDNKEFLDNLLAEVEYQVIRLRNHPSLIYWCGGNEKTGCYGNCVTHGDFLVNVTLYGLVQHLDGTRPYRRQSPHALSDVGNDKTSGDSHSGSFEGILTKGFDTYRHEIASKVVPFVSECAVMGPSSEESLRKIFPGDNIWPMNEMWDDRFMDNPYSGLSFKFPRREYIYGEGLYGKIDGLKDFIMKAMGAQSEALRAESEFVRANKENTGAFLNWMFNDIWPSGTWSTVDYYLEPKQGYYALRKAYAPILVSFYQDYDGKTHLFVDNQSFSQFNETLHYGVKKYNGDVLFEDKVNVSVSLQKVFDLVIDNSNFDEETYLYVKYTLNGKEVTYLYSPVMYKNYKGENKFSYEIKKIDENTIDLVISAETFVKSLYIHFKDNYKYLFSDNYLDMEKGQTSVVRITSETPIELETLEFQTL